ncbi:hypothetical protein H5410_003189 [Solanum commersonii]|uniref:Uncharacterized protein n=1 Tax=Solanum commersonii TaxID=4109 RepID=A0A9J6B4D0_SOLCO|nr:hypothetical protein H5410_003189 [Solanum commersonii]
MTYISQQNSHMLLHTTYTCCHMYKKMEGLFVGIDCHGEWVEKKNRYSWRWNDGKKRGGLVLPYKIIDQPSLLVYFGGVERPPILRVYVDENPIEEDHNLEED